MEWTDERIALLTRLWREGFSASQVARQLGAVSRSAVIGKVHRLGIAGREIASQPRGLAARLSKPAHPQNPTQRRASAPRGPTAPPPQHIVYEVSATATLITLSEHGCRWPIGDPNDAGFGFCGRTRSGRGSYCDGHSPMSHGRRVGAIPAKQIDHLVSRFGDPTLMDLRGAASA